MVLTVEQLAKHLESRRQMRRSLERVKRYIERVDSQSTQSATVPTIKSTIFTK